MPLYEVDGKRVETPADGEYWVAPNAWVFGDVVIAREASVWFGAVVRGDNERITIGARTNIQDGCVLHTDPGYPMTIGEGVTVGHMAMLHGCTIGKGSLVGMGAIVLNGAVVGESCLIGANTVIGERKVIPPRSLVIGTPGRVIRQLTDADVANIAEAADRYVWNWRRYARSFKPQS